LRAGVVAGHHLSVARCRLSWGLAALRGLATRRTRTAIGFRPPRRRLYALRGFVRRAVAKTFRSQPALLALSRPFRDMPQQPRTAASPSAGPKTDARLVPRCCLSWGFVPYDTVPDRRIRFPWAADPSAAACHVRGLATSFAASTTGPPGARGAGASMGFALQGVPLAARGAPLGVPALLTLPSVPPPEGSEPKRPPSGPCSRNESVLSPSPSRRVDPTVDTFLSFSSPEHSPQPPGRSLVVTMPALSPLGGMTSLPTWATGLRGSVESAWSVSGLPALLRSRTFQPSWHSVHRPGKRAHGFASRRTPRSCGMPTAL
jgi:hypothetical protein